MRAPRESMLRSHLHQNHHRDDAVYAAMADSNPSARLYYVALRGNGWEVVAGGHYLAGYSSREDAIRQAIDWAHEDGIDGRAAQVLIETGAFGFKVAWTYGTDFYPPRKPKTAVG
jgi:hypothetical protein